MNKVISVAKIKKVLTILFRKIGVEKSVYSPVIDGLVETSLRGVDSHGIRLAPHYLRATIMGRINPRPKLKFKKNFRATALLDADDTYGITAGVYAAKKAIELAGKNGAGIVVVKNSSHFAAAGIYALMIARKNMIGRVMTPVEDLVVPFGGSKPYLGTNAYCYAAPMEKEDPLIVDMATTDISFNKLRMYRKENKKLKLGWAVDNKGSYTSDPGKAVALTHFGGYKGYGIALESDIFSSLLSGMPFGPYISHMFPLKQKKRSLSHYIEAIDIKKFVNPTEFKRRLSRMAQEIRSIPPAKGFTEVMMPGDPEKKTYSKRIKQGIPLTQEIEDDYRSLAKELKLKIRLEF